MTGDTLTRRGVAAALASVALLLAGCSESIGPPAPTPQPPASTGHALVYHDSLQAVLLLDTGLGVAVPPPASTPTILWRWNGAAWTIEDDQGPPIRNLAGVAYDSRRNQLVLFGGTYDHDTSYDETWEWDPASGWRQRTVPGPGRRDHTAMAYDTDLGRIVLFGGQIGLDSMPSDTWTWDGQTWEQVATSGPAGRVHHSLAWDPIGRRVLLFGGFSPTSGDLGDTWEWSGTAWTPAATSLTPRTHASIGILPRGVVLLGGVPEQTPGSILLLDGGVWRNDNEPGVPNARYLTSLAFDPSREVTVLFGGGDVSSGQLLDDTWEFSEASGWLQIR